MSAVAPGAWHDPKYLGCQITRIKYIPVHMTTDYHNQNQNRDQGPELKPLRGNARRWTQTN